MYQRIIQSDLYEFICSVRHRKSRLDLSLYDRIERERTYASLTKRVVLPVGSILVA